MCSIQAEAGGFKANQIGGVIYFGGRNDISLCRDEHSTKNHEPDWPRVLQMNLAVTFMF
jgi:hypothetical protein